VANRVFENKEVKANPDIEKDGYQVQRAVLSEETIARYREEAGELQQAAVCVRRVLEKSEVMNSLAAQGAEMLAGMGDSPMVPVRAILFDKTADSNWPVAWHRDLTITVKERVDVPGFGPWSVKDDKVHVQPPLELLDQMITLRYHLDDTFEDNGALQVLPGSHDPTWKGQMDHEKVVSCECAAGDVLLMKPLIYHASKRSELPRHRRIVHIEYAPADCLPEELEWGE